MSGQLYILWRHIKIGRLQEIYFILHNSTKFYLYYISINNQFTIIFVSLTFLIKSILFFLFIITFAFEDLIINARYILFGNRKSKQPVFN